MPGAEGRSAPAKSQDEAAALMKRKAQERLTFIEEVDPVEYTPEKVAEMQALVDRLVALEPWQRSDVLALVEHRIKMPLVVPPSQRSRITTLGSPWVA
jgi:hypothetical protein